MIQVVQAKHIGGSKLALTFSDGSAGEVDLTGAIEACRDAAELEALLATVTIEGGSPFFAAEPDAHFAPSWYYALAHELPAPQTHEEALANEAAVTLRQLRLQAGLNQTEAAERAAISQPEVARLEKQGDMRLSTLTAYLRALGWQIEINARRGKEVVTLQSFAGSQKKKSGERLRPA